MAELSCRWSSRNFAKLFVQKREALGRNRRNNISKKDRAIIDFRLIQSRLPVGIEVGFLVKPKKIKPAEKGFQVSS